MQKVGMVRTTRDCRRCKTKCEGTKVQERAKTEGGREGERESDTYTIQQFLYLKVRHIKRARGKGEIEGERKRVSIPFQISLSLGKQRLG